MKMFNKKTILAKVETVVGVEETPSPASDAMEVYDFTMNPASDSVSRTPDRQFFGADEQSFTNKRYDISFYFNLTGSGTIDGTPPHDPLYLACKFVGTQDVGVDYRYVNDSDSTTTITMYFYQNGVLYKALGASGSLTIDAQIGDTSKVNVSMVGVYVTPADSAIGGTPDYSAFRTPIINTKDNSECSIHGTAVEGRSFNYTQNGTNEFRESTETKAIMYLDRKPSANVTAWLDDIANFDPYSLWESEARGVTYWEVNGGVGDTVRITMPATQLASSGLQDDQSLAGLNMDLIPHPTSGGTDDEVELIFS